MSPFCSSSSALSSMIRSAFSLFLVNQWIGHQRSKKCCNAIDLATEHHLLETVKYLRIFFNFPNILWRVCLRDILSSISQGEKIFVAFGRNHNKLLSNHPPQQLCFRNLNRKYLSDYSIKTESIGIWWMTANQVLCSNSFGAPKKNVCICSTLTRLTVRRKAPYFRVTEYIQTFGQTCQVFSMTCPMGQWK